MPSHDRSSPVPPQRRPADGPAETDLVVVAVDGSEASVRALVWAMEHAADRGLRVEVLTTWPMHDAVFVREVSGHFCEPRWEAREAQADATARARAVVADQPPHHLRVENADLVEELVRVASRARPALLVLGSDEPTEADPDSQRLTARVRRTVPGHLVIVGPDGPVRRKAARRAQGTDRHV